MSGADIGVYGLGTMGSALALNLAEHGFTVAVTNLEPERLPDFMAEAGDLAAKLTPESDLAAFIATLRAPRVVLMMIPSGAPVDAMIARLRPVLSPGDMLIDGGNADFTETRRRTSELDGTGLHYVGMGVSGGEDGARHGPSMMVGGSTEAWTRLRPMIEAIAAQHRGAPCAAHVGPDGAGHFVKTVHNGIEYAEMQMMAEIYGLLRDGAGWSPAQVGALFEAWSDGPLASFLVETTATGLRSIDAETGQPMVDVIRDAAGQKGTGRWTVIEALKLGQSASAIEAAVGARAWSSDTDLRATAAAILPSGATSDAASDPDDLALALLAGRVVSHAQGFNILAAASDEYDWSLDRAGLAEIWRAGCIIRSAMLDDMAAALRANPSHGQLLLADGLRDTLSSAIPGLRRVTAQAIGAGLPVPALSAALAWYDSLRHARGTANLIQAQRDIFGAHGFERIDRPGRFHGSWDTRA